MTVHSGKCNDATCASIYGVPVGVAAFRCNRCQRKVGYCMGAADEMPGLCDNCFCAVLNSGKTARWQ